MPYERAAGGYMAARKASKKVINFFVVGLTYGCRRLCTFKLSGKLPSRRIFLNRNVNVPGTIGSPPGCRNR